MPKDIDEQKRELETKLKMHAASMGGNVRSPKKVSNLLKEFYKLDGVNVSPKEIEKQVLQEPTETIYELTQKSLAMADAIMSTKGIKDMVSNPIMSSTLNPRNKKDIIIKNKTESKAKKVTNNKDPNFTTVSPNQVRPLRLKDTIADILGKMYNFMVKKYIYDDKEFKKEKKYKNKLVKLKEKHTDELISLFGGKYRKIQAKEKGKKQGPGILNSITNVFKSGANKALSIFKSAPAAIKAAPTTIARVAPTAAKIGAAAGAAGLSAAIMARESKGSPDAYNYYTDSTSKKPGNIKKIKSVIKDAGTNKGDDDLGGRKISDMTVAEIQDLQSQGKLFAVGKWQMIPSTMDDMVEKLKIDPTKQKFDNDFQDKLFADYFAVSKRPLIGKYLSGDAKVSKETATMEIAKEWSSVGVPRDVKKGEFGTDKNGKPIPKQNLKKGDSFYKGGGDVSGTSPEIIGDALEKAKASHQQKPISKPSPTVTSEQKQKPISKPSPTISPPTTNIPKPVPKNNQPAPKSDSISMLNNTTNIMNGGTTYVAEDNTSSRSAFIEKTYYG